MAKQALMWEDPRPPSGRRETKVVQLLRTGGAAWGVTETRSAFVYPRSLRPLRRIAGLGAGGDDVGADGEDPKGLEVSQLLDTVFPRQLGRDDDNNANNDGGNANTTTYKHSSNIGTTTSTSTTNTNTININNAKKINNDKTLRNNGSTTNVLGVAGRAGSTAPSSNDNDNISAATPATGSTGNTPPIIARCRGKPAPKDREARDRGAKKSRKVKTGRTTARPVFHPYGNGNTAPSSGGVVYGGYMLSYSIIPQVLPNRPHTRQVHAGTQRVAARAAARAKDALIGRARDAASSSRIGSGRPNYRSTTSRRGSKSYVSGGKNGDGNSRRVAVTAGDKEAVVGEEEGGGDGCGHQVFDPVMLFSAVPEDPQPRSLDKDRRTCTAWSGQSGRQRSSATPDPGDESSPTPPNATIFPEDRDGDQKQASDSEGAMVPAVSRSRSPAQPLRHAWTLNQSLANDPRNYKFLPRGWASELIVPAGVSGREAPSMESFFPRPGGWMFDGEGVGVTNSTAREGADKCGVGGCLRWNPES